LSGQRDKEGTKTRLDLRGLKCPLPALFARRALERGASGVEIEVLADDPMASIDVPHMCRQEGYEVISQTETKSGSCFVLRKT
jgi:tRNA 2-thiouridine synthesizing protein A